MSSRYQKNPRREKKQFCIFLCFELKWLSPSVVHLGTSHGEGGTFDMDVKGVFPFRVLMIMRYGENRHVRFGKLDDLGVNATRPNVDDEGFRTNGFLE